MFNTMRPNRHTRMRDQHKKDVGPKLVTKKENKTTSATHMATRERLPNETLEKFNI